VGVFLIAGIACLCMKKSKKNNATETIMHEALTQHE
jgi:hypothetical protein